MANHEYTHDHSGVTPVGDQQQTTQEKTRQAVETARSQGEHVVNEAHVRTEQARSTLEKNAAERKNRAADNLERVAGAVRSRGQHLPGGAATHHAASVAADSLHQAADVLHRTNTSDLLERVRAFTRSHPTEALIAAGVIGLYVGRRLSR